MVQQAVYGGLAKYGDCDNGWAMVEFAKREGPHLAPRPHPQQRLRELHPRVRDQGPIPSSEVSRRSTVSRCGSPTACGRQPPRTRSACTTGRSSTTSLSSPLLCSMEHLLLVPGMTLMRRPRLPPPCSTRSGMACLSTLTKKACLPWRNPTRMVTEGLSCHLWFSNVLYLQALCSSMPKDTVTIQPGRNYDFMIVSTTRRNCSNPCLSAVPHVIPPCSPVDRKRLGDPLAAKLSLRKI